MHLHKGKTNYAPFFSLPLPISCHSLFKPKISPSNLLSITFIKNNVTLQIVHPQKMYLLFSCGVFFFSCFRPANQILLTLDLIFDLKILDVILVTYSSITNYS